MHVSVVQMKLEADNIVSLDLRRADGGDLPPWSPGAHVDVVLKSGLVRQYSLCGTPADLSAYRIAVLREAAGRGGSREIHDSLRLGDVVELRGPRNHFALGAAERYVFIAGGIGITPILPMIEEVAARNAAWSLFYFGRTAGTMAFRQMLGRHGGHVAILPDDRPHGIGLDRIIWAAQGADIYCCGPAGLIQAVESRCAEAGIADRCHVERFAPVAPPAEAETGEAFTAVIASTGQEIAVPADRSLLHCLLDHGVDVLFSCEEGMCGSCEVRVLDGQPLHRDAVLNDKEKAQGDRLMVCVSRARSKRLVLKL